MRRLTLIAAAHFGQVCHGGIMETFAHTLRIWPRDGVRRRFNVRLQSLRLDLVLLDVRFRADRPIILNLGEGWISTYRRFSRSASCAAASSEKASETFTTSPTPWCLKAVGLLHIPDHVRRSQSMPEQG